MVGSNMAAVEGVVADFVAVVAVAEAPWVVVKRKVERTRTITSNFTANSRSVLSIEILLTWPNTCKVLGRTAKMATRVSKPRF